MVRPVMIRVHPDFKSALEKELADYKRVCKKHKISMAEFTKGLKIDRRRDDGWNFRF